MPSKVRKLSGLEIDEISLVDRPANQHGVVAIAKRAEEPAMPLYDADGYEVDPDLLEVGDFAYDEDGQEFYMASPEEAEQLGVDVDDVDDEFEDEFEDDGELVGVGKARNPFGGRSRSGSALEHVPGGGSSSSPGGRRQGGARYGAPGGRRERAGGAARSAAARGSRYVGAARRAGATRGRVGAAAGGIAAVSGGYAAGRRVNKSLGNTVLEELSKALNDGDRDEVVAKLGDMVSDAQRDARTAWQVAKSLQEQQELQDYVALAGQYDIPVDPNQFGQVLQRVSKALPDSDLQILDRVLSAAGTDFAEVGYNGVAESDVMSQVTAMAYEAVGKSDGYTPEQAITALFDANPGAYDEYLAEQR